MTKDGYGYEWDAMLVGGPADGCLDRAIAINANKPPKYIRRIVNGEDIERESLGEKLIDFLTKDMVDGNQRVAVYTLREESQNEDVCFYDYMEIVVKGGIPVWNKDEKRFVDKASVKEVEERKALDTELTLGVENIKASIKPAASVSKPTPIVDEDETNDESGDDLPF